MDILVTGGTGFIGSYVVKHLSDRGHRVRVIARNPRKCPGLADLPGVELRHADLRDFAAVADCLRGIEAVVHIAYCPGIRSSAVSMLETDTRISVFLFECAARMGVSSFLYTSTTSVNDSVYNGPVFLDGELVDTVSRRTRHNPVSLYGAGKAASENYLKTLSHLHPVRLAIIRPGYTFGNPVIPGAPIENDTRFADIARKADRGEDIHVARNDGTQFMWAGHLARLYGAVLGGSSNRETYFGLSKAFVSWENVARETVELCESTSRVVVTNDDESTDPVLFDVSDMEREFDLRFDPSERITEHLRYLLSNTPPLSTP